MRRLDPEYDKHMFGTSQMGPAIANTAPASMADRLRQAHAFFRHRTPEQMLATTAPWTSAWLPDSYVQNIKRPA